MNSKSRQALFLAINSAGAFIFTLAALGVLTKATHGLPAKVVQTIGPQLFRIIWPLLALELIAFALGIALFCRARKRT